LNKPIDGIPDDVMQVLRRHNWPGIFASCRTFIERAVLMTEGRQLQPPLAELTRIAPAKSSQTDHTLV
jgi:transcriptional regulator with PAS, ATPase and Fis domain